MLLISRVLSRLVRQTLPLLLLDKRTLHRMCLSLRTSSYALLSSTHECASKHDQQHIHMRRCLALSPNNHQTCLTCVCTDKICSTHTQVQALSADTRQP